MFRTSHDLKLKREGGCGPPFFDLRESLQAIMLLGHMKESKVLAEKAGAILSCELSTQECRIVFTHIYKLLHTFITLAKTSLKCFLLSGRFALPSLLKIETPVNPFLPLRFQFSLNYGLRYSAKRNETKQNKKKFIILHMLEE